MLFLIKREPIWEYLSTTQQDLIQEGNFLMSIVKPHRFKDYSFLVFPFAKVYEGYLKQLFLDVDFITHQDYISNHFRIGKYLSPHMAHRLQEHSVFTQIRNTATIDLAKKMWNIWKQGRNEIIHYYPHNLRSVTYLEAKEMNEDILHIMIEAYEKLKLTS